MDSSSIKDQECSDNAACVSELVQGGMVNASFSSIKEISQIIDVDNICYHVEVNKHFILTNVMLYISMKYSLVAKGIQKP